jgi:c-di-AMP phosphodiesterase-like protein
MCSPSQLNTKIRKFKNKFLNSLSREILYLNNKIKSLWFWTTSKFLSICFHKKKALISEKIIWNDMRINSNNNDKETDLTIKKET